VSETPQTYYGRPILKEPVWKPEIPWYFFSGGLAGASACLAFGAELAGNDRLARDATLTALAAGGISPILLIRDLGRPARFLNMLRVVKVTSPMSLGTWILTAVGSAIGTAGACELLGVLPRVRLAGRGTAALFGLPLSTYTAALLADTAIPAWHEARHELPFVFAGSAAASAGAAAAITTPPGDARAARRLALGGAALEIVAARVMRMRLGDPVGDVYRTGLPHRLTLASEGCTVAGAALLTAAGRRHAGAAAAGALLLAGSALERWAVFKAGFVSARDPRAVVVPQRNRARTRGTRVTTARPDS
jgi:hypothetical protein